MNDLGNDGADAVVDAETGFIPRVEGEENGVVGEEGDAFGKGFSENGWLERVRVCGMMVEKPSTGLMEYFEDGRDVEID